MMPSRLNTQRYALLLDSGASIPIRAQTRTRAWSLLATHNQSARQCEIERIRAKFSGEIGPIVCPRIATGLIICERNKT